MSSSLGLVRSTQRSCSLSAATEAICSRATVSVSVPERRNAHARITRAEWLTRALGDLLQSTPGANGETAIAAFVDLAERAGEESLAALEVRIRERRREREGRS